VSTLRRHVGVLPVVTDNELIITVPDLKLKILALQSSEGTACDIGQSLLIEGSKAGVKRELDYVRLTLSTVDTVHLRT
jgi:hypothetical protein